MGRALDWIGTRVGIALAMIFWSGASMLHASMATIAGFSFARFLLGLGESGNFPACIKTVAEWFPKKERALATGILNAGSNVGAIAAPLAVPWIYLTWGFVLAKFLTDSIWRWYLYLLPLFFSSTFKLDIKSFGPPFLLIYCLADVGSVGGGWLSSRLIRKGWSVNAGRKTAMLVCALCVVPVVLVTQLSNMWAAVWLVGLAAAAHQGWSANLFTTASDMFPRQAVGSVVGLGGMAGALGAMLILKLTGYILAHTGSYTVLFLIAGSAYLLALLVLHLLAPRLETAKLGT